MARITRLRTSPDTLLAPGEGLKRITNPAQLKHQRQQAELSELKASGGSEAQRLKLLEKHLKENRK
jgi:hypothetical protein